jgi:hypothetical protein
MMIRFVLTLALALAACTPTTTEQKTTTHQEVCPPELPADYCRTY